MLWDWPIAVKDMDIYSFVCITCCFHGQKQPILTDPGRGEACLIFNTLRTGVRYIRTLKSA